LDTPSNAEEKIWTSGGRGSNGVTGGQRKLHNEELCNFYLSPKPLIKPLKIGWVEHVARIEMRITLKAREHLKRPPCW